MKIQVADCYLKINSLWNKKLKAPFALVNRVLTPNQLPQAAVPPLFSAAPLVSQFLSGPEYTNLFPEPRKHAWGGFNLFSETRIELSSHFLWQGLRCNRLVLTIKICELALHTALKNRRILYINYITLLTTSNFAGYSNIVFIINSYSNYLGKLCDHLSPVPIEKISFCFSSYPNIVKFQFHVSLLNFLTHIFSACSEIFCSQEDVGFTLTIILKLIMTIFSFPVIISHTRVNQSVLAHEQ